LAVAALALVLFLGWRPSGALKPAAGLIYETESAHNYIQVLDFGAERQLRLNEGEGIHSVYRPGGGLADGIWDTFLIAPAFNPAPYGPERVRRAYVGGLAAGTIPKLLTEAYGPIAIDGAELDPEIIRVGRDWFGMTDPNLNAVAVDARRFLTNQRISESANQRTTDSPFAIRHSPFAIRYSPFVYDLIAVDAYRPPYIPFHLTTVEFFQLARDRLADDGVVAVNVGRTTTDYSLVDAIAATMRQVFPSVFVVDLPDGDGPLGNSLVVATRRPSTLTDFRANLPRFAGPMLDQVAEQTSGLARQAQPPPGTPIFTDDRAPVEQVVHALVLRQMFGP
jgi:spermidine synthase